LSERIILDIGAYVEIDPVAGFRAFICASSGYGKSYLAAKIVEELLDRNFLVVIFDTEGEYHTLRQSYNLLIIGRDVPLDIDSAEVYASLLLEKNVSLVFDFASAELSDFEAQDFFAKFGDIVFQLENKYKKPLIFVIEEAEIFAPQVGRPYSLIIANKLAKRGRKRGIHSIWITQRPADFNKMVLSQCNVIFCGRVTHERDIKALEPYVGKENTYEIKRLMPSEKIFVKEDKVVKFTVRGRKTPHGADTPLVPLTRTTPELKEIAAEIIALINKRQREREKEQSIIDKLRSQVESLQQKLKEKEKEIEQLKTALMVKEVIITSTEPTKCGTSDTINLPKYEQRILSFLTKYQQLEFTKTQIARSLGLGKKSSRLDLALRRLLKLGLIKRIGKNKFQAGEIKHE